MTAAIGFLHTAEVHVDTFGALVDRAGDGTTSHHVVDPALLDEARRRGGVDPALRARLLDRLTEAARGCSVVVCTCSTLSGATESMTTEVGVPVVRVDRPLARRAVQTGPRIAVVVALASTLGPTTELLAEEAERAGVPVTVTAVFAEDAWDRFEAGDHDGYLDRIAGAARGAADGADVIVLAQASMADAVHRLDRSVPVLAGPELAVEEALRLSREA